MAIRNSWETQNRTYSVDQNIDFIQHQFASVLYISGLDGATVESYTIDDSLSSMRETFKVTKESILVDSLKSGMRPAYQFFMSKNASRLGVLLRRNSRWLKIANYIKENQNG